MGGCVQGQVREDHDREVGNAEQDEASEVFLLELAINDDILVLPNATLLPIALARVVAVVQHRGSDLANGEVIESLESLTL